ncbi:helix-turn-helix transcriptional regulator [Microbulbifer sp. 2205BS26-8]|uniref:helix-turn-helix transcriptional regulator n=1 Tax=Microbulbifer sp. 2205BS26-8 TaxID=3064386 RepID=UPI0035316485
MSEVEKIVDTITAALRGAHTRLWTSEDIAAYLSCSESTVFRISAKSEFPQPVKIAGIGGRRWVSEEVRDWAKKQRPSRRVGPGRPRAT